MSRYEAPEVGAMIERMCKALARRAGDGEAEAVEQLARLEGVVSEQLGAGVLAHRLGPAEASWTTIGELVGTSRQAAHRRFVDHAEQLTRPEVERVDKYTVQVSGVRVTATADQEARLRGMTSAERDRFATIMGKGMA